MQVYQLQNLNMFDDISKLIGGTAKGVDTAVQGSGASDKAKHYTGIATEGVETVAAITDKVYHIFSDPKSSTNLQNLNMFDDITKLVSSTSSGVNTVVQDSGASTKAKKYTGITTEGISVVSDITDEVYNIFKGDKKSPQMVLVQLIWMN